MNKYESVIIINPSVDEEGIKAIENKYTDIINSDGKDFEAKPELIAELERNYRIDDSIMKFITIKK